MFRTLLTTPYARQRAQELISKAPDGWVAEVREPRRTNAQNDLMWALLGDVSRARPEGRELTPEVWKSLFLHSLGHQQRFELALDGKGVIPIGFRSSRLTKAEFSELIEVIREYGARHGVRWSDERKAA